MLKIKDSTGKTVGVLKDDDDAPVMEASAEILPPVKQEAQEEEKESEEDADVR